MGINRQAWFYHSACVFGGENLGTLRTVYIQGPGHLVCLLSIVMQELKPFLFLGHINIVTFSHQVVVVLQADRNVGHISSRIEI